MTTNPDVLRLADEIREEHWPNFDAGVIAAIERATELAKADLVSYAKVMNANNREASLSVFHGRLERYFHLRQPEKGSTDAE